MSKSKKKEEKMIRPAITPEGREAMLIDLAMDSAEKQMREGTASSQVISHFLKLGTEKARLEKEQVELQNRLLEARTEEIKAAKNIEELYKDAIEAMKTYGGHA